MGGSDLVGRTLTERWGRALGQSFTVENIGGGGGVIACQTTARAVPDGYTLLQSYVATHGTSPATRSKLPYDAIKDFTPVGMIGSTPNVLVVNASLPPTTLAEVSAYVRAQPGRISHGSAGQGSLTHLTMELYKVALNAFMVHLPYRGIAPAFTDLLGGQTQAMFPGLAAALPAPVLKALNESLAQVLAAPDLRERLSAEVVEPQAMSPEAFAQFIRADIADSKICQPGGHPAHACAVSGQRPGHH